MLADLYEFQNIVTLLKNFTGNSIMEHEQEDYWHKYSRTAMCKLLQLRLKSADLNENIKIINPDYVFDGSSDAAERLAKESSLISENKTLVNLNLYNKHWVGLAIDKSNNEINIHYIDSVQQAIPVILKEKLIEVLNDAYPKQQVTLIEDKVEHQKYNNCGLEAIENFVYYLTGQRLSQEDTLPVHSLLFEDLIMLAGDRY